jgi:hypothetical protein
MKTTAAIQDQLKVLYALQKEQEAQVTAGISKLTSVFTPGQIIADLLGAAKQKAPQESNTAVPLYSPLWDKLTNQIGITSPVTKSAIHLVLDQLVNKWLSEQAIETTEKKPVQTADKAPILDHSLNHF